ncbi:MAG: fasciclin domain-containing protein [Geitlerinemataceae cyanobacterium]
MSLPSIAQFLYPSGIFSASYDDFRGSRGCDPNIMKTIACALQGAIDDGLDYRYFARAVKASGLMKDLSERSSDIEFTVFVPKNSALSRKQWDKLLENEDELVRFVKSHIVRGQITEEHFQEGEVRTLAGSSVRLQSQSANEALLTGEDGTARTLDASNPGNGIVIKIDRALVKPNL